MKLVDGTKEVEIRDLHWPLAKDLFVKWGYSTEDSQITVRNIDDITAELSVWGIPWQRTKWTYE